MELTPLLELAIAPTASASGRRRTSSAGQECFPAGLALDLSRADPPSLVVGGDPFRVSLAPVPRIPATAGAETAGGPSRESLSRKPLPAPRAPLGIFYCRVFARVLFAKAWKGVVRRPSRDLRVPPPRLCLEREAHLLTRIDNHRAVSEDAFWVALEAAVPGWRDRRGYPIVFAGFQSGGTRDQVETLIEATLGTLFAPASPIDQALDEGLDRIAARAAIARALTTTLAYSSSWVEAARAESVGDAFVACFAPEATFRTNGDLLIGEIGSAAWDPLTSATFDTGVVALDSATAGILWVVDED